MRLRWPEGWRFWALAGAIAIAGAVVVPLLVAGRSPPARPSAAVQHAGTTSSPPAGTTRSSSTGTTLVPAGQQATRAAVPWASVSQGWILATWQPPSATTSSGGTGTSDLVLLDPEGGRYVLERWTRPGILRDWSGDGVHALFLQAQSTGPTERVTVTVLDIRTGASQSYHFSTPTGNLMDIGFSQPEGKAIVIGTVPLQRYTFTGAVQLTYPTRFPAAGVVGSTAHGGAYAESPDGTRIAIEAATGIDLVANTGKFLGFLPAPAPTGLCFPVRWWQSTSVLVSCGNQLWSQPADGSPATDLTPDSTAALLDEWDLPSGTIGQAGGCGTWLVGLGAGGAVSPLTVPGFTPGDGHDDYVGANGPTAGILVRGLCQPSGAPSDTLMWFDPGTNGAHLLLGGSAPGGGSVSAAIAWGGRTRT